MIQLLSLLTMPSHSLDNDYLTSFFFGNLQAFDFQLDSLNISCAIYFLENITVHLETNEDKLMKELGVRPGSSSDTENTCKVI